MKFDINSLRDSSVLALYEMRDRMQMDPIYQRPGSVWSPDKRQLLVDSLLNKFDIAKFYLHSISHNSTDHDFAIIDGRQRFETIWRFMEDRFALDKDFKFFEDPSVQAGSMKYSDLAREYPRLLSRLHSRVLDVSVVYSTEPELVEDMFSRLNEAVPLNAAEKRNALGGPIPPITRDLSAHAFMQKKVPIRNARYRHYDIIVKMLYLEDSDEVVDTKKTSLDLFVKSYKRKSSTEAKELKARTSIVLDAMAATFTDTDPLLRSSSVLPVYYTLFSRLRREGNDHSITRQSLERFETLREENRALFDLEESEQVDLRLIEYDDLSQSSNDSASIRERYSILRDYLKL